MTTQRITGLWLIPFTSCVVLNHLFRNQLSYFDIIYASFLIPLILSAIIESKALKVFQVGIILLAGAIIVAFDPQSRAMGFSIMLFAPVYSHTYGFLERHLLPKAIILGALYVALFIISLTDIIGAVMWLWLCLTINGAYWINNKESILKNKKLDEIIQRNLEQKLGTSEALLEETVKAGMVLVDEIKSKETKDGCE